MQDMTPHARLIDAAENVLIAWGMGWGLDGVMQALEDAMPDSSFKRSGPAKKGSLRAQSGDTT